MEFSEECILLAKAGDRTAFVQLMKQVELPLYQTAWAIVKKPEDCDDAMQEAVLKAFKSIHTLREPSYFKTWIFRILINECFNILGKNKKTVAIGDPTLFAGLQPNDYSAVDLRDAVDRLEENLKVVIVLHYYQDMNINQIASILQLSPAAVKTRLYRARQKLLLSFKDQKEGKISYGTY
ncbi:sigma-70 family RNA polymerase sigma factor [Paenibacillus sp. TH7-28]